MERILREPIEQYLNAKQQTFASNQLASKLRKEYPELIRNILTDQTRYKITGSSGKGNWTDCPWIAILDILVTETPQAGYYPVFLFKSDMSGVYLSLNQGVTEVEQNYKRETKKVLRIRAEDFRAKLDYSNNLKEIDLVSNTKNAKLYEAGNIIAKYYPADNLPDSNSLTSDILEYLHFYEELTFNNTQIDETKNLTGIEKKQYRLHYRMERNSSISRRVKALKGYICEACDFGFNSKYGELGNDFIEAHHLTPFSQLEAGTRINLETDFAVLCSNCHRMIHRLEDPVQIEVLRRIIKANK